MFAGVGYLVVDRANQFIFLRIVNDRNISQFALQHNWQRVEQSLSAGTLLRVGITRHDALQDGARTLVTRFAHKLANA